MATVLVIDDEAVLRKIIGQILTAAGFTVFEAAGGKEGRKIYQETAPDIVIIDLVMPGEEGIETITKLIREFAEIKIIAISGASPLAKTLYLSMAQKLGAKLTLKKPFTATELITAVESLLPPNPSAPA
jgi:DNA-binding response OmpR family regulator